VLSKAVDPGAHVRQAYTAWYRDLFPQYKNLEYLCRLLTYGLTRTHKQGALAASRTSPFEGLSETEVNNKLHAIQKQVDYLQMDNKSRKEVCKEEAKAKRAHELEEKRKAAEERAAIISKEHADLITLAESSLPAEIKDASCSWNDECTDGKQKKGKKDKKHKKDKKDKHGKKDKKDKKGKKDKTDKPKKDKKEKHGKKDKKDKKGKKGKDKHDKEAVSKNDRIKLVETYLEGASDSIAKFAGASQVATDLAVASGASGTVEALLTPRNASLAKASIYQLQAENCYRKYAHSLRHCTGKDAKCLLQFEPLHHQCTVLAKNAHTIVNLVDL